MGNLVPVASREIGEPLGHEPLRALDEGLAIAEFVKSGDNAIATSATKSRRSSAIGASPKYLGGWHEINRSRYTRGHDFALRRAGTGSHHFEYRSKAAHRHRHGWQ